MFDLSISIVVYRGYEDVKVAVKSIEEFTDTAISKKIYIIDNSCYEDTNEKKADFTEFLLQWNDVEYIDTKVNLGFGKGHNYVLNKLDSKYHAIVNPDIILQEDSFDKILSYMKKENVGVVVPKLVTEDGQLLKAYRREITVWDMFIRFCCPGMFKKRKNYHTMDEMDYTKPFDVPFAQGSFLVIKTELYKEIEGFDDRYFMYMEDADLCKRVNKVSVVRYLPDTTVIHKWEKGSHKNNKLLKIHIKSMFSYFRKWGFKFI